MINNNIRKYFKELLGEFHLLYKIYYTEILSTKCSLRLFGVDSILKTKNKNQIAKTIEEILLKKAALASASMAAIPALKGCSDDKKETLSDNEPTIHKDSELKSTLIVPKNNGLQITGTFLDEISHDIPHQNWGEAEWDLDFQYMKAIGIDTVIMIRSGYKNSSPIPLNTC